MAKKKSNNKTLYIIGGSAVLLIIVLVILRSAGVIGPDNTLEVELGKTSLRTVVEKVNASGTIQPVKEVKLSPDVAGEIIELNIEEGDSVVIGTRIIKIRPDNFQSALDRSIATLNQQKAALAEAKARLARAEAEYIRNELQYNRNKNLHDDKVISDSEFEVAEANFKVAKQDLESAKQNVLAGEYIIQSAQASVNEAQQNLRFTDVLAPVSGIVSKLLVEQGERVVGTAQMAGTEMLRIADLNIMEVRVDVNENDIIRISVGDTAVVDVDAYSNLGRTFKGVVTSIANTAKEKTNTEAVTEFEVRIRVMNESFKDLRLEKTVKYPLRPGMTASVEIMTNVKEDILSVPLAAVTTRAPKSKNEDSNKEEKGKEDRKSGEGKDVEVVFVKEGNIAKMVEVETGISDFDYIEILNGLEEGQEVITGPFMIVSKRLQDGDEIKVKEGFKGAMPSTGTAQK